jgi:hypothetical protein
MTKVQSDYIRNVALIALGGGIAGALLTVFVVKKPTTGDALLGTVLGAGVVSIGAGFAMRTGATPGATFAGLARSGVGCMACGGPPAMMAGLPYRGASWPKRQTFRGIRAVDCMAVGACQG